MGILSALGIENPFGQIKQNLTGMGEFPPAPPPPTPEAIKSLDDLIAKLFPEQAAAQQAQPPVVGNDPWGQFRGLSMSEGQSPRDGVYAAGAEQGMDPNNPLLGAAAALKEQETGAAPEAPVAAAFKPVQTAAVERKPLPAVQPRRPGPGRDMAAYRQAIKDIESSGGDYSIVGPTHPKYGRALGAYQVMESNLPSWSKEVIGRVVSPEEFLANPHIQDQIFDAKFGQSISKWGSPEDAASVWFTGRPASNKQAQADSDSLGTTGAGYVAKFQRALGNPGTPPTQMAGVSVDNPAPPLLDLTNRPNDMGQPPAGDPTRPPPKNVMQASLPGEEEEGFSVDAPQMKRRQELIAQFAKKDTSALKRMPRSGIISLLQEMGRGVAGVPRITKTKEIA